MRLMHASNFNKHTYWLQARKADGNKDTEKFITARGTQQMWRIGWSFYAGAVGAWVIVAPSQVGRWWAL